MNGIHSYAMHAVIVYIRMKLLAYGQIVAEKKASAGHGSGRAHRLQHKNKVAEGSLPRLF